MFQPMQRLLVLAIMLTLTLSSCYVGTAVVRNLPGTADVRFFDNTSIQASPKPFYFAEAHNESWGDKIQLVTQEDEKMGMGNYLAQSPNLAMLIIRGDSVLYEWYAKDYQQDSKFASFSMVKSFISVLVGIAIDDGLIPGVNTPICEYFPELSEKEGMKEVTLAHLLNMTAGFREKKSLMNPKAEVVQYYYGKHLERYPKNLELVRKPGTTFQYSPAASTQMIAFILEKVTGKKIYEYLHEKIWSQIGTEDEALWSLDREDGNVKAFCCLNARARDFARFGRLMLNNGNWEGKQIVPLNWMNGCTMIDSAYCANIDWKVKRTKDRYRYHWWQGSRGMGDFRAIGLYGQIVHVFPQDDMVIVSFAKRKGFDLDRVELDLNYQIVEQFRAQYAQNDE